MVILAEETLVKVFVQRGMEKYKRNWFIENDAKIIDNEKYKNKIQVSIFDKDWNFKIIKPFIEVFGIAEAERLVSCWSSSPSCSGCSLLISTMLRH